MEAPVSLPLLIHRGAHESSPWRSFLSQARERFGLSYASVILRQTRRSPETNREFFDADGDHADERAQYREKLFREDPIPYHALEPERPYRLREVTGEGFLFNSAFYRDCLYPMGLADLAVARLCEPGGTNAWLTFACREDVLREDVVSAMHALLPHLTTALQSFVLRERMEFEHALFARVAERIDLGTVVLSADARVLAADQRARESLARHDISWSGEGGELRFGSATIGRKIVAAARKIAREGGEWVTQLPGDMPLQLLIAQRQHSSSNPTRYANTAHMFVHVPLTAQQATYRFGNRLTALFGLTPLEASIVDALCEGQQPREIARSMMLTEHTVRSYLKSIFAKLGARRQADVVRIVLGSILTLV